MVDIYRAPNSRGLVEGRRPLTTAVHTGAVAAIQVSLVYSVIVLGLGLLTTGKVHEVGSGLIVWAAFAVVSMIIAVMVTLSYGLLVHALLDRAGHLSPLWFCGCVLITAIALLLIGEWRLAWLRVVAYVFAAYGLPIAWLASARIQNQQPFKLPHSSSSS